MSSIFEHRITFFFTISGYRKKGCDEDFNVEVFNDATLSSHLLDVITKMLYNARC